MIWGAAYQAEGKKGAAIFMYAANLSFLIICEVLAVKFFGLSGAWWGYVCANVLSCALSAVFVPIYNRRGRLLPQKNI